MMRCSRDSILSHIGHEGVIGTPFLTKLSFPLVEYTSICTNYNMVYISPLFNMFCLFCEMLLQVMFTRLVFEQINNNVKDYVLLGIT